MKRLLQIVSLLFCAVALLNTHIYGMAEFVREIGGGSAKEVQERFVSKLIGKKVEEKTVQEISENLFKGIDEGTFISRESAEQLGKSLERTGFSITEGVLKLPTDIQSAIGNIIENRSAIFGKMATEPGVGVVGNLDKDLFDNLKISFQDALKNNAPQMGTVFESIKGTIVPDKPLPEVVDKLKNNLQQVGNNLRLIEKDLSDAKLGGFKDLISKNETALTEITKKFETAQTQLEQAFKDNELLIKKDQSAVNKELNKATTKEEAESLTTKKENLKEYTKNITKEQNKSLRETQRIKAKDGLQKLFGTSPVSFTDQVKNFFKKEETEALSKLQGELKAITGKDQQSLANAAEKRLQIRSLEKENASKLSTEKGLYGKQRALSNKKDIVTGLKKNAVQIDIALKDGVLEGKSLDDLYDEALIKEKNSTQSMADKESTKIKQEIEAIKKASPVSKQNELYLEALKKFGGGDIKLGEEVITDITAIKQDVIDQLGKDLTKVNDDIKVAKEQVSEANAKVFQLEQGVALTDEPGTWAKARFYEALPNTEFIKGLVWAGGSALGAYLALTIKGDPLVKAMKKPYRFANMWLMVPPQFINDDDPAGSLFLYVGLLWSKTTDPDIDFMIYSATKLDASRSYFTEHTEKKESKTEKESHLGLTGSYEGSMLSLRTGDVFVSGGKAADSKNPTLPIVGTSPDETTLRQELEKIEGNVRNKAASLANLMAVKNNQSEFSPNGAYPALGELSEYQYPALINASIAQVLSKPVPFVNRAGVTKFNAMQIIGLPQKRLQALVKDSSLPISEVLFKNGTYPFALLGTYVYQTNDTNLAKEMRTGLGYTQFSDYVVFLDANGTQVPLYIPQQGGAYNFFNYEKNNDIVYMKSLLDGSVYQAKSGDQHPMGTKLDEATANSYVVGNVIGTNVWEKNLAEQIKVVKQLVANAYKSGEYHIGAFTAVSPQGWAEQGIHIYQLKNVLAGGTVDDYIMGLKKDAKGKNVIAQLPQDLNVITQYFSLVSSRCYDAQMNPWTPPAHKSIYYGISISSDKKTGRFFYSEVSAADVETQMKSQNLTAVLKGSDAEQYTMYMDADINPIDMTTLGSKFVDGRVQVALNIILKAYAGASSPMVTTDEVHTTITDAWKTWKTYYIAKVFDPKTRKPRAQFEARTFAFYNGGANNPNNVYIAATNSSDVTAGLNVYTSATYPQEYLAVLTTWSPTTKVTDLRFKLGAYAGEQYVVSIATGMVYDGKARGTSVFKYDADDVWKLLQAFYARNKITLDAATWPTTTVKKIAAAVATAEVDERDQECGTTWGSWRLYLNSADDAMHQYIYGDLSQATVNQYIDATKDALEKKLVTDWVICGEYATDKDGRPLKNADGTYQYIYGRPFDSTKTQLLMSLVTLIGYNNKHEPVLWNAGKVTANMSNRLITSQEAKAGFATLIGQVAKTAQVAPSALRLYSTIQDKLNIYIRELEGEQRELALAKAAEEKRSPLLDVTVQELLQTPVIDPVPGMLPRNLRKAKNGKYYQLTPQQPTDSDVIYVTSYNATTEGKDAGIGYVYEIAPASSGARKAERGRGFSLTGEGLALLRAHAGVEVAANGAQTLSVGFESPNLSVDHMLLLDASQLKDYQTKYEEAVTTRDRLRDLDQKGTITPEQTEELRAARQEVRAYTTAIDATNTLTQKPFNKQISAAKGMYANSKATIEGLYLDASAMVFVAKIKDGADSYYLDLQNGFVYDVTTGRARVRPVFIGTLRTVGNQVLVGTKDANNRALFMTDAVGLKRFVFQSSAMPGSFIAKALQTNNRTVQEDSGIIYNEYEFWALVPSLQNQAPINVEVTVKESPVDPKTYAPNAQTIYTVSEGEGEPQEIGTYKYDAQQSFGSLLYYTTRSGGNDLGFVDADKTTIGVVTYLWNGDEKRIFTDILYNNQLVKLTAAGNGAYTGSVYSVAVKAVDNEPDQLVIDPSKTRSISVKQVTKKLPANLTEDIVTITDGDKEYGFHYVTELIADIDAFVRDVIRLTPIADVNGIMQLTRVIPDTAIGLPVAVDEIQNPNNVSADAVTKIKAALSSSKAVIKKTKDNSKILYTLQANDLEYGKYTGFKVDLISGIVYNAFGVPFAGVTMVELLEVLNKLGLRVLEDKNQNPYLIYHGV